MKNERNKLVDLEKIKNLCEEKRIPFAELGRNIGLETRELISRRLNNQYTISADELYLIADELGVEVGELRLA